jgi:hypothetical protein
LQTLSTLRLRLLDAKRIVLQLLVIQIKMTMQMTYSDLMLNYRTMTIKNSNGLYLATATQYKLKCADVGCFTTMHCSSKWSLSLIATQFTLRFRIHTHFRR